MGIHFYERGIYVDYDGSFATFVVIWFFLAVFAVVYVTVVGGFLHLARRMLHLKSWGSHLAAGAVAGASLVGLVAPANAGVQSLWLATSGAIGGFIFWVATMAGAETKKSLTRRKQPRTL